MSADIARVLAEHQKVSMGMTSGSPDTCRCGERIYPERDHDVEVTLRRDVAFAAHQAAVLAPLILRERAEALREAAEAYNREGHMECWPVAWGAETQRHEGVLLQLATRTIAWLRDRAAAIDPEGAGG